jgi:Fe-S-cluster containining protein
MGDRCTGHCCRYFSLGPPEQIAEVLERDIALGGDEGADAQKVKDLLIYRGYFTNPLNEDQDPGHWYTCKHFVVDDNYVGYCGIYEDRPAMCHHFPNGQACAYAKTGCTWDWAHRPQRPAIDVTVRALTRKKREATALLRSRDAYEIKEAVPGPISYETLALELAAYPLELE